MVDSHATNATGMRPNGDIGGEVSDFKSLTGSLRSEIRRENTSDNPDQKDGLGSSSLNRIKPSSGLIPDTNFRLNGVCKTSNGHHKTFHLSSRNSSADTGGINSKLKSNQVSDIEYCLLRDVCFDEDHHYADGDIYKFVQASIAREGPSSSCVKSSPKKDAPESLHKSLVENKNKEDAGSASDDIQGENGNSENKSSPEGGEEQGDGVEVERTMDEESRTATKLNSSSCSLSMRRCMARTKQCWHWLVRRSSKISVNAQGEDEMHTFLTNEPHLNFDILVQVNHLQSK